MHDTVVDGFILGQKNLAAYHALKSLYKSLVDAILVNFTDHEGTFRLYFLTKVGTTWANVNAVALSFVAVVVSFSVLGFVASGCFVSVDGCASQVFVFHVHHKLLINFTFDELTGAIAFGIVIKSIILVGSSVINDCQIVDHKYARPVLRINSNPNIFDMIWDHVCLNQCVAAATIRYTIQVTMSASAIFAYISHFPSIYVIIQTTIERNDIAPK